ncbi:hypothetical protein [Trebonia sp.]|uniref:hypothetical protein n=1 Tax=Trebonia sp. TaxID=2767075 RepID=UPI002638801D|nr:hypothetical protein [Trebonia sp.]
MLFAVDRLRVHPGGLGLVIGAGAFGAFVGTLLGRHLEAAPLALVPLASPAHHLVVLAMLFAALFMSGFGVMALDVTSGAIFASVIPDAVRSRVSWAFQAINCGTRPAGALLLLPSPLPRFRRPA